MIGIICGMVSEARCVARAPGGMRFALRVSGASAAQAREDAAALARRGASLLVSFGLSGALDPECPPGRLLLPSGTVLPDGEMVAADPDLLRRLAAMAAEQAPSGAQPPLAAPVAGSDEIIRSAAEKAALHRRTGAAAVDMESHAVAAAAREAGIPYVAIRAVADPATRTIPETAMAGLAPDGTTRPLHVIRGLMRRPRDLPALIRLGRDAGAGLATLRGAALHLLPAL